MSEVPQDGEAINPTAQATARVLAALREVASRQPGVAMSADPVAVEMVGAALAAQFSDGGAQSAEGWSEVAAAVVRTLEEDPAAWPRVERLWDMLQRERKEGAA